VDKRQIIMLTQKKLASNYVSLLATRPIYTKWSYSTQWCLPFGGAN